MINFLAKESLGVLRNGECRTLEWGRCHKKLRMSRDSIANAWSQWAMFGSNVTWMSKRGEKKKGVTIELQPLEITW